MSETIAEIRTETDRLVTERGPFEAEWAEIRRYMLPTAGEFYGPTTPGFPDRTLIDDSSGEQALDMLTAAIVASVFNPATAWLELRLDFGIRTHAERLWLDEVKRIMLAVFASPQSRFPVVIAMAVREFAGFGTGAFFVEERPNHYEKLPLFRPVTMSELYVGTDENDMTGRLMRRFRLTARQALDRYNKRRGDWLPPPIVEAAEKPETAGNYFWFRHYIARRRDADGRRLDARGKPWGSWTLLDDAPGSDGQQFVRESGYDELPLIAFPWLRMPGRPYGRGPGGKALPEIRMSNEIRRQTIEAAEKAIRPPLLIASDGVLGDPDLRAAGENYVEPQYMHGRRAAIEPLLTGTQPLLGIEFHEWVRKGIDDQFMKPLMQLERDPRMTATQALILEEEQLRGLAPLVSHLETELLGPLFERVFAILMRMGFFPPMPASLGMGDRRVHATFVSPSARAQKLSSVRGFSQRMDIMAPVFQADPTMPSHLFDVPQVNLWLGETLGVPPHVDFPIEDARARLDARDEAANQAAETDKLATLMASGGKLGGIAPLLEQAAKGPNGTGAAPQDLDANAPPNPVDQLVADLGGGADRAA